MKFILHNTDDDDVKCDWHLSKKGVENSFDLSPPAFPRPKYLQTKHPPKYFHT